MKQKGKNLKLTCTDFLRLIRALAGRIPDKYRTWLMIGTNGFRVGAALFSHVDDKIIKRVNLAYIQAQHYKDRSRQKRVHLSQLVGQIEKPVLIIDDIIDSGDTIMAVRNKLKIRRPDTAVIFRKPWAKIKPDFFVRETEKWIIFPWE
jgi:hypoxanthine phosphoribosyltransferase